MKDFELRHGFEISPGGVIFQLCVGKDIARTSWSRMVKDRIRRMGRCGERGDVKRNLGAGQGQYLREGLINTCIFFREEVGNFFTFFVRGCSGGADEVCLLTMLKSSLGIFLARQKLKSSLSLQGKGAL